LSAAYAVNQPWLRNRDEPFLSRHGHLLLALGVSAALAAAAWWLPALHVYPAGFSISTASWLNQIIRDVTDYLYDPLDIIRNTLLFYVLIPVKNFFIWLPWPALMLAVGFVAWRAGGWGLALMVTLFAWAIAASGLWPQTMLTLYLVAIAVILCIAIGVPI